MAMDKRQFLDFVINAVREVPINEIVGMSVHLLRKGGNYFGLCPFHNDHKIGSFVVSSNKNIYKCFSCGEGGDGVKFLAKTEGISYVNSAFKLALHFGIISNMEYDDYFTKRRYSKRELIIIEKQYQELDKEKFKADIAEPEVLNKVFNIFLDACSLSPEHKEHLMVERKLTEKGIEDKKYKTFPTRYIIRKLMYAIVDEFGTEDILEKVPGFYKEEKSVRTKDLDEKGEPVYKSEWLWTFVKDKGIIIPIKNAKEQIIGLQVRRDYNDESRGRYVWFSSSFASFSDKYKEGTSSGCPIDVVYPKEIKNQALFITEGRFKAEKIAETQGSIAISVQGVGTWSGILDTLNQINESSIVDKISKGSNYKIEVVYLAFDADINYKPQVWQQAKKMTDVLEKENYLIYYLNWNEKFGKGIDDLLISGNFSEIKRYNKRDWDKGYELVKQEALDSSGFLKMQDVPVEVFKDCFNKFMKVTPLKKGEK